MEKILVVTEKNRMGYKTIQEDTFISKITRI